MNSARAAMGLAALASVGLACVDPPVPHPCGNSGDLIDADVRYSTTYADIAIAPEYPYPLCGGTLQEIDDHVERVSSSLGIDVTRRLPVYLGGFEVEGCASCLNFNGDIVALGVGTLRHELTHGVTCELGHSDRFYSEGVAEMFEGLPTNVAGYRSDWEPLDSWVGADQIQRGPSEAFTRWLFEQYGDERLRTVYAATDYFGGASAFADVFSSVYGISLADAEAEFLDSAPALYPPMWEQCSGLEIEWNGDTWSFSTTLDCDQTDTMGPYLEYPHLSSLGVGVMYQHVTLVGQDDREYLLAFDDDLEAPPPYNNPGWGVAIIPCVSEDVYAADEAKELQEAIDPGSIRTAWTSNVAGLKFQPGRRYRIELIAPLGTPREVRASFIASAEQP